MAKNDFQYGRWNSYTLQCGTIMTLISPGDCTLQYDMWLWNDMPLNSPKRPPYWNSTSCFDFDHITVVDMSFCTSLRNFIQIVSDTLVYYSFHQLGITMKGMSVAAPYRFRTQYYSYKL